MRASPLPCAAALASLGLLGCSHSNGDSAPGRPGDSRYAVTAAASHDSRAPAPVDSNDGDPDPNVEDDYFIVGYGHPANAAERHAVATVVKRYYEVAATGNGAKLCSMLTEVLAESMPEQYAGGGTTCAAAVSLILRRNHRELTSKAATLRVTGIRTEAGVALAIFRVATSRYPRRIAVKFEHGRWKLKAFVDSGIP
jgi:hypothetical protein